MLDPQTGQWFDNGQHLLLGCCTELLALHRQFGFDAFFERKTAIPFARTDGKHWTFAPSAYLPGAWKFLPALLRNPFIPFGEKVALALSLQKLGQEPFLNSASDTVRSFLAPFVYSALSETPENVAPEALQFIVRQFFFSRRDAADVYIPQLPLRKIYHDSAAEKLQELGVELFFLHRVQRLLTDGANSIAGIQFSDKTQRTFDYYISAIPSFRFGQLADASEMDEPFVNALGLERFEPGAITTVHLWLDKPLLPKGQEFAALLGGPGQFVFQKGSNGSSYCYAVIISAAHRLLSDNELIAAGALPLAERVLEQLRQSFLTGKRKENVELQHHRVTTYFDAVFSPSPAVYACRPGAGTPFSNLFLAGDWTQTGFPSTMEGAVRSGLNAVEELCSKTR